MILKDELEIEHEKVQVAEMVQAEAINDAEKGGMGGLALGLTVATYLLLGLGRMD